MKDEKERVLDLTKDNHMNRITRIGLMMIALCVSLAGASIIKSGDVLDIVVQGHPEFSGRFTVSETGTIDYPLLADEQVVNITTSELMNDLTLKLVKHIDNPLVIISIIAKPEIVVYVLGQVKVPGPVKTYQGATLQEVLQMAGGPLETANIEKIKIVHKNLPDESAEYFDMKAFLSTGNMADMPKLKPDDTVILLGLQKSNKVKVIGAVNKPGFFDLTEKTNIFELIYLAGGPSERGDLSRVRRFTQQNGKSMEEVINVQAFLDKGEMDNMPIVSPGDVVMVYERWYDWRTMLSILNNVLLFVVAIQALTGAVKF
jgi:protein involved in polysaccharide export with SLBB domain